MAGMTTSLSDRNRMRQLLPWAVLGLIFTWALFILGSTLTPLIAALLIASVLAGPVDRLTRIGVPRALAATAMILLAIAMVGLMLLVLLPIVQKEIELLRLQLPDLVARLTDSLLPWIERTAGVRIRLDQAAVRGWLSSQMSAGGSDIAAWIFDSARSGGSAALEAVSVALLVPIVLFYVLLDWHLLCGSAKSLVPPRWRDDLTAALSELHDMVTGWLHGVLLLTVALAIFYAASLWIAGFELWWSLGVLTGLLMFIPYLGFALALVLALIAGMLQFGLVDGMLRVGIVYAMGQAIESWWLTPKLVGERIGLHPIAVILCLLVFGALLGFVGILLALPMGAAAIVILRRVKNAWVSSRLYRGEAGSQS